MNSEKIGKFEAICLILIIIVNEIVLNVPNLIINITGSSAVINTIFISIIAIIFAYFIYKLFLKFKHFLIMLLQVIRIHLCRQYF